MSSPRRRHGALRIHWALWLGMAVVVVGVLVFAGSRAPEEGTSDDRLYGIAEQLKCLQCVGESVAGSQSPLAVQFRDEIRSQMEAGNTDDEILAFFADRYGTEVLLDPPTSGVGALAWLLPLLVAGAAVVGVGMAMSRWRTNAADGTGPRIDEVVAVGASTADASSGATGPRTADEAAPTTSSGAREAKESTGEANGVLSRRWNLAAILGGLALFVVLTALILRSGSGERGDGELTGGTGNGSSSSAESAAVSEGVSECQPIAMSDPAAGIDCYDRILQEDPDDAEALTYRGWARVRSGDLVGGREDLTSALELAPESADPHVFLALAAIEEGDFTTAAAEMERFWAADPSGVAVSVVQSEGLERTIFFGLMSQPTRTCWQSAAEAAPEGDIDQVFLDALGACLDGALATDPSDRDLRLSRALAHLGPDTSDPEAARLLLDELLTEDPSDSDALVLLVSLDIRQGALEEAQEGLDRLEELPRGAGAFLIGDVGALTEALAAAREARIPNPEGG